MQASWQYKSLSFETEAITAMIGYYMGADDTNPCLTIYNLMVHYELYRRSSLGITLTDVLDEFIQKQLLSAQLAMRVLSQFDRVMSEALSEHVRVRSSLKVS